MPAVIDIMDKSTPMVAPNPTTMTMDCQKRDFRLLKFRTETMKIWRNMAQRPESAVAMSICLSLRAGSAELASATMSAHNPAHAATITVTRGRGGTPMLGGMKWGIRPESQEDRATPRMAPREQGMAASANTRPITPASEKPMVLRVANSAKRSRTAWAMPLAVRNSTMNMPASAISLSTLAISTPELETSIAAFSVIDWVELGELAKLSSIFWAISAVWLASDVWVSISIAWLCMARGNGL